MNNSKTWSILCLVLLLALLLAAGGLTALIDPFFHYHAPLETMEYPLNNQRYQNDGIVRHFDYDALITGTSMTENFKTSEFDALFGTTSVKVSYSGGTFPELTDNLRRALEANPNIRTVLMCIDEWFLFSGREMIQASGDYPTYLYDDDPFNDVQYLLNKEIFCTDTLGVLEYTAAGNTTTHFDDYGSWVFPYDREVVLSNYQRLEPEAPSSFTPEHAAALTETAEVLLTLADSYPDTEFIFYFPPYSILNWDNNNQKGILQRYIEGFRMASDLLLGKENIRLFSFCTDFDTVTNLDNYRDIVHHSNDINSLLLRRFAAGEYELTADNAAAHWDAVEDFYGNYDYDGIFADVNPF